MEGLEANASQAPRAEIAIPRAWLETSVNLDALLSAQRPGTEISLGEDTVTVTGAEVVLERPWFSEKDWTKIQEAIRRGYVRAATETELLVGGDRRSATPRRTPVLLARVRAHAKQ